MAAEDSASPRRAAFGFILVNVWLDVLALGVIIPVLPPLIQKFTHGDAGQASLAIGLFGAVFSLVQFFAAPVLGALSDHFGRRPVLLISLFGLACDYLLMALAPSLGWLFVGRVISGVTAATGATAGAYIADTTPPEQRARVFGWMGSAWGLGFIIGPALGGWIGAFGVRLPFFGAAAMTLVGALYGLLVLPESLPKTRRSTFAWGRANPVGSLTLLRSHPELWGLSGVNFLMQLAHNVLPTTFVLYASNRYGWSPAFTGSALALTGICNIVVQSLLVGPVVARIGERGAVLAGLVSGGLGFAIYGLAPTGPLFLLGTPVFAFIGLFGPGYQALISRHVSPSEQGRLRGANASIDSTAGIIGPALFGVTYAWFVGGHGIVAPGAAFLLAALLHVAASMLAVPVMRRGHAEAAAR